MTFGEYLRAARKSAGLSQVKLAMAVGLDHTYVSKVESGALQPFGPETLEKMAAVLGVEWEKLFEAADYCVYCKGKGKHDGRKE